MKQRVSRTFSLVLVSLVLITPGAASAAVDYASLDGMSASELAALQADVSSRLGGVADGLSEADEAFLDALEQSVSFRMSCSESADREGVVNRERAVLYGFRDVAFENPVVSDAADLYFKGLEEQASSFGERGASAQSCIWLAGFYHRCTALNMLFDEFGFMGDNIDFLANYVVVRGEVERWGLVLDAYIADFASQDESGQIGYSSNFDASTVTISAFNNTEYSFRIACDIDIVRYDGILVYSTSSSVDVLPYSPYEITVQVPWSALEYDGNINHRTFVEKVYNE